MTEHQIHCGKKFYQDKKTGYWISTDYPRIRAHAWVWITHHGEPPPHGYHIHHVDGDKSNNKIDNLQILTQSDHSRMHSKEYFSDPENLKKALVHLGNIRDRTKEWHASPEGIEWHRQHGIKVWEERELIEITCKQCNEKAHTKIYDQVFCSNKCKSAWRRGAGFDNIEKTCERCNSTFIDSKYSKQKYCGMDCLRKTRETVVHEMISLRKSGISYENIGKKFGMDRAQASAFIRKYSDGSLPYRSLKNPPLQ